MELDEAVKKLKKTKSKEECLMQAYQIVSEKYRGYRFRTYTRFWELFAYNVSKLWKKSGFMHCTNINRVLKELLIRSGHFDNSQVKKKWTLVYYISPHQYLQVDFNGKKINVDVWGKYYGVKFGEYTHGFN